MPEPGAGAGGWGGGDNNDDGGSNANEGGGGSNDGGSGGRQDGPGSDTEGNNHGGSDNGGSGGGSGGSANEGGGGSDDGNSQHGYDDAPMEHARQQDPPSGNGGDGQHGYDDAPLEHARQQQQDDNNGSHHAHGGRGHGDAPDLASTDTNPSTTMSRENAQELGRALGKIVGTVVELTTTKKDSGLLSALAEHALGTYGGFIHDYVNENVPQDIVDELHTEDNFPPLAIDLDGDGAVSLINPADSAALVNIRADGFMYRAGWVGPNDGMLVYDSNGDGRVTFANELSFTGYVPGARTDLEGLRHFDSNGDGRLSAADTEWSKFRVWRDANSDGRVDDGEMVTPAAHGLVSLALAGAGGAREVNGNRVFQTTGFARADGGTTAAWDVGLGTTGHGIRLLQNDHYFKVQTRAPDGTISELLLSRSGSGLDIDLAGLSGISAFTGTSSADTIRNGSGRGMLVFGGDGDDRIAGGTGNDVIAGNDGADWLVAGAGNDVVMFDGDDTFVDGGSGTDTAVWTGSGAARIAMTLASTTSVGSWFHSRTLNFETVIGGAGNDRIRDYTNAGVTIHGMQGDDVLIGGTGDDTLVGGAGNDRMQGGAGRDIFDITQGAGATGAGSTGTDQIFDFTRGIDRLKITDKTHVLYTRFLDTDGDKRADSTGIFVADGFADPDNPDLNAPLGQLRAVLKGYRGDISITDFVDSSITAVKSLSAKSITGTARGETIHGDLGPDTLRGLGGDDQLYGGIGDDRLYGGTGDDTLHGQHGRDRIWGGGGDDTIHGGRGNDILYGGNGNDRLYGGDGNDIVQGGLGTDILTGGAGSDIFIVMTLERTVADADRITDFAEGDRLLVTNNSRVWYDRTDTNGDGRVDTTILYNAASNGRVYAVLDDFIGPLDSDDFYGSNITAVTSI